MYHFNKIVKYLPVSYVLPMDQCIFIYLCFINERKDSHIAF